MLVLLQTYLRLTTPVNQKCMLKNSNYFLCRKWIKDLPSEFDVEDILKYFFSEERKRKNYHSF